MKLGLFLVILTLATLVAGFVVRRYEKRNMRPLTPTQIRNLNLMVKDLQQHGAPHETNNE
jgi:hypothetical protein